MRLRFAPSLFALAAASCVEDVPIAAECPPDRSGPCLVEVDGSSDFDSGVPPKPDARVVTPAPDSGPSEPVVDASPRDAAPIDAAQVDASPADAAQDASTPDADAAVPDASTPPASLMPVMDNASFEFASSFSVPGDVTTLTSLTTNLSPWYTCQPVGGILDSSTGVRAETSLSAGITAGAPKVDVKPTDGKTFVTLGYFANIVPVPLMQPLKTPLQAGQRYSFAIDALTTSDSAMLALVVLGNSAGCLGTQTTLYESTPITSLNWTKVCVSFTAPAAMTYMMLSVDKTAASIIPIATTLLSGPRLVLDNLREATPEECPDL